MRVQDAPDTVERGEVIDDQAPLATRVAQGVRRAGDSITGAPAVQDDLDHETLRYERSSRAVIRLIGCILAIAMVALAGELLPHAHQGLERDLSAKAGRWVVGVGQFGDAMAIVVATISVLLAIGAAVLARRPRQVLTAVAAAIGGAVVVVIAAHVGGQTPGVVSTEEWALAIVAAAIAVGSASFSVLAAPVVRWASLAIGLFTIVGVLGGEVSLASRVMAIFAGGAMGALAALAFGTATRRVSRAELADAMAEAGLPVAALEPHGGDARGSQPWIATLATDRAVFVKVTAVDELRSDQLFRFWRRLRLSHADDERSAASVRRSVEHEAFVSGRAAAAGVSTPGVLALGELRDQRGMFAAFTALDGATLDEVVAPSDSLLRGVWSQVQMLRRAHIAHRDLRAANVMASGDDPWLVDFGFAEVAATADLLDRDLAEMLVSTSAIVGIDRAVENAVAVLGADELKSAIPWIQPLAVSAASRAALSRDEFDELREQVRAASGATLPQLPQLQRVSRKAVIACIALGIAVWTVLPRLTKGINWNTVAHAHLGWAGIALVASAVTYVGAAVSLAGSVTDSVPLPSTFFAQIASSFTNRITPAKVGGLALNVRYLTKQGVGTAEATTGVAVSTAAGTAVHILLTVVAVVWAGKAGLPGVHAPSVTMLLAGLGLLCLAAGVVAAVPPLRTWAQDSAIPSLRRSFRSFVEVMKTPRNVLMLLGGSLLVTVANLVAFGVSLRAFDIAVPMSTIAVVYLAGSALASAAPTPGGLGAAEAALVAGLAVVSVHQRMAIPAVLLFRLATFWIPIIPGWIAFTVLQHRGDL